MKAGRELDAIRVRIATEIMGLELWYGDPTGYNIAENMDYWVVGSEDDYGELSQRCPNYPVLFADAWLVVEKMTEEGFCPALLYDDDGRWALSTDGIQNLPGKGEVLYTSFAIESDMLADTAPLAICLAALAVVERRG